MFWHDLSVLIELMSVASVAWGLCSG